MLFEKSNQAKDGPVECIKFFLFIFFHYYLAIVMNEQPVTF